MRNEHLDKPPSATMQGVRRLRKHNELQAVPHEAIVRTHCQYLMIRSNSSKVLQTRKAAMSWDCE